MHVNEQPRTQAKAEYLQNTFSSHISTIYPIQIIHKVETTFPSLQSTFIHTRYKIGWGVKEFQSMCSVLRIIALRYRSLPDTV
jgi:hypothetical protein